MTNKCSIFWGTRRFTAKKFPKGSEERKKLNKDSQTSEYLPSYKYYIHGFNPETHGKKQWFSDSAVNLKETQEKLNDLKRFNCKVTRK